MLGVRRSPAAQAPSFALLLALSFALFLSGAGYPPLLSVSSALLISAGWLVLGMDRRAPSLLCYTFFIISLAFLLSYISVERLHKRTAVPPAVDCSGKVIFSRPWGRGNALLVDTEYGRLAAYVKRFAAPAGSGVKIRAALFPLKRAEKRGDFDEFFYWRPKGAVAFAKVLDIKVTSQPKGIYLWRAVLEKRIKDRLPEKMAGYMLAITTGTRVNTISEVHKRDGTAHILAVSGFHVALIAAIASLFFRRGKVRVIGLTAVIWIYVLFAGMPAGGVRAAVMVEIWLLGMLFGRPSFAFNSVSAAGVAMLLYSPWLFFDLGWRLSMSASLYLTAFFTIPHAKSRSGAAVASLSVWFVTAPIAASSFKTIPAAGAALNIIALMFFSIFFPVMLLLAIPALAGLPAGALFAYAGEWFLEGWGSLSSAMTSFIPWAVSPSLSFALLSAFVFGFAVQHAGGYSMVKAAFSALLFPVFLLLFL